MTPNRTGVLTAILAFAFYSLAMNLSGHGWRAWYEMSKNGQWTEAVVTKTEPEIHRRCFFQYAVGKKNYEGRESGCAHLAPGAKLRILYLPDDPSFTTTRDPRGELTFMIFGPLALSVIGGVVVAWRKGKMGLKP